MVRRKLYHERIQCSWQTLIAAMATVPMLVYVGRWFADLAWPEMASLAIGTSVAIAASRLLKSEEARTFYLMILVACLVGTYAFWIPESVPFYLLGASLGLTCAWQAPAILTAICAIYGISEVKVYPMPRWRPEIRNSTWPESIPDASSVVL